MPKIDAYEGIIFDYGGVLVHHQTAEDQTRMADILGIPIPSFNQLYWSDLRLVYDKGLLSAKEYWQAVAAAGQSALNEAQIDELTELDVVSWMHYDESMWEWIGALRAAGKRLAMLSNMPRDLGEALRHRTRRFDSFDHVTLSYELKAAKPEAVIYQDCLAGLGTSAAQTLFLDDRQVNIEAAEKLGIHGRQFTSREEVLPALI
ncbi:MAG TPA: HAD family phosphatase [Bryobacteraceae bacterium]|jgi:putative hydrolase of the HAD superfamily|nr:HAD family phosphatase [Bryobacteraceae bacterium]